MRKTLLLLVLALALVGCADDDEPTPHYIGTPTPPVCQVGAQCCHGVCVDGGLDAAPDADANGDPLDGGTD